MSSVSQYSDALVLAHRRYHDGITNETGYAAELATAVSNFDNVGTLIERIQDALNLLALTEMSLKILGVIGIVEAVGDLPVVAANGDAYKVNNDGHIWGRIAGSWMDLGAFKGDPGSKVVDIVFSVNNAPLASETSPAVVLTDTVVLVPSRCAARCRAAPTSNYVGKIIRNSTQIGTVTWTAGSLSAVFSLSVTTLVPNDMVWIEWPVLADPTFVGPSITLSGDR